MGDIVIFRVTVQPTEAVQQGRHDTYRKESLPLTSRPIVSRLWRKIGNFTYRIGEYQGNPAWMPD
ncbi:MAG: hypothetical protein K2H52_06995 [Lachnospiraceae bacterium]|nr:hypothetical protein [Lachnospiraceae bacterium]MDE6186373.1 hypothetical protein [Lachnospiraceae bacterium]